MALLLKRHEGLWHTLDWSCRAANHYVFAVMITEFRPKILGLPRFCNFQLIWLENVKKKTSNWIVDLKLRFICDIFLWWFYSRKRYFSSDCHHRETAAQTWKKHTTKMASTATAKMIKYPTWRSWMRLWNTEAECGHFLASRQSTESRWKTLLFAELVT